MQPLPSQRQIEFAFARSRVRSLKRHNKHVLRRSRRRNLLMRLLRPKL